MIKRLMMLALPLLIAACDAPVPQSSGVEPSVSVVQQPDELRSGRATARAFVEVVQRIEPIAEAECRRRTQGVNCDFNIVVERDPNAPSNAFQTLDAQGRPIIVFTIALLEEARNIDEIAFVMGHEAAHHIEGHIAKQRQNAALGAVLLGGLATQVGAGPGDVQRALELGAAVGARSYSKDFELEADALGTRIAAQAGFSPLKGAQFFNRIPDPGDRFLGTHPPNAERLATVRRVAAGL